MRIFFIILAVIFGLLTLMFSGPVFEPQWYAQDVPGGEYSFDDDRPFFLVSGIFAVACGIITAVFVFVAVRLKRKPPPAADSF